MIRTRKAILHIGTAKTGSSSIQAALQALRGSLPAVGFAYPRAPGERNHTRLALYATAGEGADRSLARLEQRISGRAGSIAEWLPLELGREMAALPDGVHTVLFSNEHCHSRVQTAAGVRRVKALLDPFFSDYQVVVYLRRQDEVAVSRYTTRLRSGSESAEVIAPGPDGADPFFDYAALLDRWGEVFGRAALRPRIFARAGLAGGDVVADFLALCGVAGVSVPAQKAGQNPALSAAAQEFLRRFNGLYKPLAGGDRPREMLNHLGSRFGGQGRLPARARAEAFHARFAEGNERIRAEHFPDRASLFDPGFGRYPEVEVPVPGASVLEVARAAVEHLEALPRRRREAGPELGAALRAARAVVLKLSARAG